jgi:ubiquinone/menaquinone biosynthesis C-methylase UbiE
MTEDVAEDWIQRSAEATRSILRQDSSHGWLLRQSMYTHYQRVACLLSMPCFQGVAGSILDVGAGTGALGLDLAWRAGKKGLVTAVDSDVEALRIAQSLAERVGLRFATLPGDAAALPVADDTQDMTVSRFLFQHLPDPGAALSEMRRVTRPGGRIVIVDVDDEVTLREPPTPGPLAELRKAIRTLQRRRGGNRLIGRQLYRLMRGAGLEAIQVIVIPRVRLGLQNGRNAEVEAYQVERVRREREELIRCGLMTADDFDSAVAELERGFEQDRFEMEADIVASGMVPAAQAG